MFDRIIVNNNEYQTKAFGKSLHTYKIGDEVRIRRAAFTTEEYLSVASGVVLPNNTNYNSYQVECISNDTNTEKYINVYNNKIVSIGMRDKSVPLYNYYGKIIENGEHNE